MLTQLTVSNYAIAEHLELHFDRGMTALTGETGAGKSIALDALGLALGDRADAGAVRHGAERADIAATFDIHDNPDASDWLKAHDLDADDPECILRRVLGRDGRSRAYINGRPCTLQDLRDLGARLIDIHSQHHHQSLLRKDHHRRLLDEFAGAEALADAVRKAWQHWHQAHSRWQDALTHHDERDARLQLLRYQVEEFERLNLAPGEIEALEQEQSQLANAEQLLQAAHQAAQLCEEAEPGAIERVQQAIHKLESLPTELP
ncbi:MAG: AAA family ATPase, partial [Gammaproteobacteria bacterium]|nr:AAA family ATPase [Gammaproteobacteria bacterium]